MDLSQFTDSNGLLGHVNEYGLDMGDCLALTGRYYYLNHDRAGFRAALNKLRVEPGIYIRHPNEPFNHPFDSKWAPGHDQITPIVCALGEYPDEWLALNLLTTAMRQRKWKYQNADWATPERRNIFRRSLDEPVSLLGDLILLGSTIWICLRGALEPSWVDQDPNHSIVLDQAIRKQPTKLSRLAHWVYYRFRNVPAAIHEYLDSNPPLEPYYERLQR
jgi:hypothetical protein